MVLNISLLIRLDTSTSNKTTVTQNVYVNVYINIYSLSILSTFPENTPSLLSICFKLLFTTHINCYSNMLLKG